MNSLTVAVFAVVLAAAAAGYAPLAYSGYAHAPLAYSAYAAPSISTTVVKSAPLIAAHHPIAYAGHGLIASPYTAAGYPYFAAGSGIEGQYAHDYTENLYDDGSYKGEIYA